MEKSFNEDDDGDGNDDDDDDDDEKIWFYMFIMRYGCSFRFSYCVLDKCRCIQS
jgi:hypothetical protein